MPENVAVAVQHRAAIIDGKAIAAKFRSEILREAQQLADQGWQP